jgi:transcription termination/antitermination protein NusG
MGKKMPATKIVLDGVSTFPRWYTVVTKFNYEQKLAETIMNGIENAGFGDRIFEVLVPIRQTVETKVNTKGQRVERKKQEKIYPLYIFVKAIMTDDVWNYIKNSEGSAAILAPSGTPIEISEDEILKIKEQCGLIEPEVDEEGVEATIGMKVRVVGGPLMGQQGVIERIKNGNEVRIKVGNISVDIGVDLLALVV